MPDLPVVIGARGIDVDDVHGVAVRRAHVELDPAAVQAMRRGRDSLAAAVAGGTPIYGVTTGLGARSGHILSGEESAEVGLRTVRGRATAVGDRLPEPVVRAGMLARLASMATGGSGASLEIATVLADMLNAAVHPVVPSIGSLGTGDLAPMAHVALVVAGEGRAVLDGREVPGAQALSAAGLTPVTLGIRDGLALVATNAMGVGHAALISRRAGAIAAWAHVVAALTFEGFRGSTAPLQPDVIARRSAPGEARSAAALLALLDSGDLPDPRNARRLQDPVSLRGIACVHGALLAALDFLRPALRAELTGAGDNPIVLAGGVIAPSAGFHTPALALALDTVSLALAQTAAASAQRCARLLSPAMSGLPVNLTTRGRSRSGFAPLLKTSQALVAEIRHDAAPTVIDPRAGAAEVEDDSSNLPLGVRRLDRITAHTLRLLAIEAVTAAQAVELSAPPRIGAGPQRLYAAIREVVAPLDDDRPLGAEIEAVAAVVFTDEMLAAIPGLDSTLGHRPPAPGAPREPTVSPR
ncbi:MAG: HAL/PAL/TAL family ammonia-lyase [Mycobacteriales bacterium]